MNGQILKRYKNLKQLWIVSLAISLCVFAMAVNITVAGDQFDTPPLIGVVIKMSPAKGVLVVKPANSEKQQLVFTEHTALKGVQVVQEIKVRKKVKVWYVLEKDLLRAVKIEVMPDLGC